MAEIFAVIMFTGIGVVLVAVAVVVCVILIGQAIAARRRSRIATRVAQKRCPKCGYGVAELTKPGPEPDIRPVLPFSEEQALFLMRPHHPRAERIPHE